MTLLLIDSLEGREPGILDSQLAELAGFKTNKLNEACKRSTYAHTREPFRYQITEDEWKQIRGSILKHEGLSRLCYRPKSARPYIYSFEGAFLVLSRIRANITQDSRDSLLKLFSKDTPPLIDYGTGRREEHVVDRLTRVFKGVATVIHHHPVRTNAGLLLIDVYFQEWNVAVEIDELQHRWNPKKERMREAELQKALGCKIIRFVEDDDVDRLINRILRLVHPLPKKSQRGDSLSCASTVTS